MVNEAGAVPRAPEQLGYRRGLDGLRGVAIMAVLVAHSELEILPGANIVGVDLFFVLSGFLITTLLGEELTRSGRVDLPAFYLRRVRRLMPALVAFVGAVMLVSVLAGLPSSSSSLRAAPFALTYTMNLARMEGVDPGILSHTWSLAVEEHFYLLWPTAMLGLVAIGWRGRRMIAALLILAMTSAAAQAGLVGEEWWYGTHTRGGAMLVGCAAAVAWSRGWRVRGAVAPALILGALLLVDSTGAVFPSGASLAGWLAAAWLVVAAVEAPPRALQSRVLVSVGTISYGLYLWHRLVYALVDETMSPGIPMFAVQVAGSVVVAAVSWSVLESRFLRARGVGAGQAERGAIRPLMAR